MTAPPSAAGAVDDDVFAGATLDRSACAELLPMARRIAEADGTALLRIQARAGIVSGFALLPTTALVGRRLVADTPVEVDATVSAVDYVAWAAAMAQGPIASTATRHGSGDLASSGAGSTAIAQPRHEADAPARQDLLWRGALPPSRNWTVLDTVPDTVVKELVAQGADAHRDAQRLALGARAAQDLLDLPVLTVTGAGPAQPTALVTNRSLAAILSMAFLPPGRVVSVAVSGRWTRVAAPFGSVWSASADAGFSLL